MTVNAGGVLAPGTVGTPLTISGNLTLASGADYAVAVTNASGNTSWAAVTGTGTATLASVLSIAAGAGVYSASDTYTVLSTTAANGVNGTFSGINIASGSFGNFVPYLTYNANSVVMDLTAGNTWNGTTSTWNTTTNWSTGIVPTANAILPQNTVATFSNDSASPTVSVNTAATVATLLFASTSTQAYTFNIAGGNSLTLSGTGIDDNSGNPALAPKFNVGGSSNGTLAFQGAATAGDAIITTNSGGLTEFSGNSTGGTAQFNTTGNGVVDFSGSTGPAADGSITADSIAGLGNYYLGNSTLVLEGPQSTTVSGVISDCGSGNQCKGSANGTTGGALVMVGAGTLTLSGANTYSGGTTLSAGTVNVGVNSVFITAGVPSSGIVSSAIGTGPLSFNGGTLQAGGAYTIANAAQISVASPGDLGGIIDAHGNTFTLAGNIADDPAGPGGTLTITSTGAAGTVVFSGMNSYSGATTINSGATLAGGAANALSANSAVTDNGTLDLGSVNQTIGSLSGSGTVTNLSNPTLLTGTAAPVLIITAGTGTFSGTIENGTPAGVTTTTGLTLAGGTLTLSGATASYSGATTIDSGADLTLTGPTSIASSSGVTNNGTFDISGNGATTIATLSGTSSSANVALGGNTLTIAGGSAANPYDGSFTGSGGLTIAGGALALFGASPSYSGTTTIDSGATLQVGANGALGTGALTFASGSILQETLQAGANNLSFSNSVTLNNPTDSFDTHGNTLTWTGAITGSGNLNVADSVGGGTVILSNVGNSYSGATTVNSGTLSVIGSIASSSGVTVNGGTLSGIGTVSGVTVNNGGTLSPGSSGNPIGTLTITGNPANTNLTMATGANYVATITGSNDADTSLTSVTGKASLAGTLTLAGTGGSTSATYEILSATGVISGTFSGINITGSFGNDLPTLNYGVSTEVQLTLTAGTVWSGATSSDWLGAGNWQGGIPPNSATAVAAFDDTATNKSVIISSADGSVTVGTMLFNANAPAYTITVNSGGTLTLATNGVVNESTTTTPTFNVAGSLLFSGNSTAANSQLNVLSGGVVNFSGSLGPSGNGLLSVGSISNGTSVTGGSILLGSNTLSVGSNNLSTSFNGTISGIGGSLNKVGTGTQTLGGNNTYSGGTTITAGTLQAGSNTAVGTSTVTLSGGTFQAGANNLSLGNNFSLSNTLSNAIDTFGKTLTLAGTITGTGPLIVESSTGSGTLTLTGANNYSGVTNVNFGTLQLDSGGSLTSSSDVNVNAGGIFAGIGNVRCHC